MLGAGWESWKLAHAYHRIGSGTTPTSGNADYYDDAVGTPWITTSELRETYIQRTTTQVTPSALEDFTSLRTYAPNSVFMAMYGATIGRLGISTISATCNQACCVFEASDKFDNRFLFYWLWHRRAELISLSVGGGQPNLSQQDLKSERALCPPLETQKRIVAFLDEKTAQIDKLIARKQALLERLAEKRQATITHAVTKGLNPAAAMKESGFDWLGQIPAHWGTIPLKWQCSIQSGQVDPTEPPYDEMTLVAPDHIESGTGRLLAKKTAIEQAAISGKYLCHPENVLYSKIRPALRKVTLTDEVCLCSADMYAVAPGNDFERAYLFYILLTDAFTAYAELASMRVAMPKVNREALGSFPLIKPPIEEQQDIIRFIRAKLMQLDDVTVSVNDSVARLIEYRSALITSAVTGQIEWLR